MRITDKIKQHTTLSFEVYPPKSDKPLEPLLATIREARPDAEGCLGVDVGLADEKIVPLAEVDATRAPYFSTVLVTPARTHTGGRL